MKREDKSNASHDDSTPGASGVPQLEGRVRTLLLPGWLDSDVDHWQSRWERSHSFERVQQDDWLWPRRGDWMARLEDVLSSQPEPAVLVAHSLGCHLVAAWAAHSQHTARVLGTLMVAPPDVERSDMPPNLYSWRPIIRQPLPFVSTVVLSLDDPYCHLARGRGMAEAWGATVVEGGAWGHINAQSGLGDWPGGYVLLNAVRSRATA